MVSLPVEVVIIVPAPGAKPAGPYSIVNKESFPAAMVTIAEFKSELTTDTEGAGQFGPSMVPISSIHISDW